MKVCEKFISINGEGLFSGHLACFIRFVGCNLRCNYCDTVYSYDPSDYEELSVDEIVDYVKNTKVSLVTLTGGEPLIQKDIKELLTKLSKLNIRIEIETNGSVLIKDLINIPNLSFTLDYKLDCSNMSKYMVVENYKYIRKSDSVKFVVGSIKDLEKTLEIINNYDLTNITNPIISVVFNTIDKREVVDFMIKNNMNNVRFQLQIHKFIWPIDERGV